MELTIINRLAHGLAPLAHGLAPSAHALAPLAHAFRSLAHGLFQHKKRYYMYMYPIYKRGYFMTIDFEISDKKKIFSLYNKLRHDIIQYK